MCTDQTQCLEQLSIHSNLAVATSHQHALNNPSIPREQLYCFAEDQHIHSYLITSLIREDHPHLTIIDDIIQRSFEGGLFIKWFRDNVPINKYRNEIFIGSLTVEHLAAGFMFYLIGIVCAIIAYAMEIIVKQKLRKRKPNRLWKFMEKLVDDKRYILYRRYQ